jgi:tetrahydromethanopterin S-methyltransferase subunit E
MPGFAATGLVTGVAFRSVVFTGSANTLVFDNITFGALVIPEPASISLLFIVLASLGFLCRNRIRGRATH